MEAMPKNVPFELSISGHATIPHPAERALINVSISSTGTNKASVADEVVTTAKHIEELLREISPQDDTAEAKAASPLAHWNKTSLSSRSWMPRDDKNNEQPPMKHSATVKFDIRFKEFKALGSFGTRISSIPHVHINDIDWILTTATEESYRPQLRRDCAKDALEKAKDYCEILGCTNLRPVSLTENNYYAHSGRSFARNQHIAVQSARGFERDSGSFERPDELEFKPQEVKMTKDITVKFHADAVGGGIDVAGK